MGATSWRSEPKVLKYEYDFDVLGGLIGTYSLGDLPDKFMVSKVYVYMETALAGGATVDLGEDGGGDADGYVAAISAGVGAAELGAGALVSGGLHLVDAAKDGVLVSISIANATAGKFQVYVEGLQA